MHEVMRLCLDALWLHWVFASDLVLAAFQHVPIFFLEWGYHPQADDVLESLYGGLPPPDPEKAIEKQTRDSRNVH